MAREEPNFSFSNESAEEQLNGDLPELSSLKPTDGVSGDLLKFHNRDPLCIFNFDSSVNSDTKCI